MRSNLIVINMFAGPSSGKSTTASDLFSTLNKQGISCELVGEFAKEAVWDESYRLLDNQLLVSAVQFHRLDRLVGKVDVAITDTSLLLGLFYLKKGYLPDSFRPFLWDVYNDFTNINFFVERSFPFKAAGRVQNELESKALDMQMLQFLQEEGIPFHKIKAGYLPVNEVLQSIYTTKSA